MSNHPIRFGVIGLGMGYSRSKTVTETPGAELVAVCDLIDEKCQRAAAEFGVYGGSA